MDTLSKLIGRGAPGVVFAAVLAAGLALGDRGGGAARASAAVTSSANQAQQIAQLGADVAALRAELHTYREETAARLERIENLLDEGRR